MTHVRMSLCIGYFVQATTCLGGAITLYSAIDQWFLGKPFWSACFTVLSYLNGHNFVNSRASNQRLRRMIK